MEILDVPTVFDESYLNYNYLVYRYFECWQKRDTAALLSCFKDNGIYHDPVNHLKGIEIAANARAVMDAYPDLQFEIKNILVSGNQVAVSWVMHGTNTGKREGKPATGRSVSLSGTSMFEYAGERIQAVENFYCQKSLLEQLGYNVVAYKY